MKRTVLTYLFLLIASTVGNVLAQNTFNPMNGYDEYGNQIDPNSLPDDLKDSTQTEIKSLPPKLYMWQISEKLGDRTIMPADTASLDFQNTNLVEGMTGYYNYLGNLGSPRLSRIFFERREAEPTIFMEPYSSFFVRPEEVKFTNSNIPYTNLTYYKAGSKTNGEERFKAYFSVNANKRLALGFNVDYLYGRGYYANQSTAHFNGGVFGSYIGQRYQMHAVFNYFNLKMNENGGITDDQYITRPENMAEGGHQYESNTIPVNLEQTTNRNDNFYVYLTHRYRLGFTRETTTIEERQSEKGKAANDTVPLPKDTILTEEFVPVTSFIHTLKIEKTRHKYSAQTEPDDMYENTYFTDGTSLDSTTAISVKNTIGIALLEGFNKYAKAGLTAYLSHKFSRYSLRDSVQYYRNYTEQEVFVGGELAKREGQTLHYNVNGEVGILGEALGQFRVNADLDLNFRLWNDTVNFYARGYIHNTLPSFYMRHYHSNHYYWDYDNMNKEFRTRIEGELNIARWRTNLRAGMENIKNYTYFGSNGLPAQASGNIQVLSAKLKQDFKLGVLHLDNEVTWQQSSNQTVLPLPKLSLYHNLYLLAKLFKKVLTIQLGGEVVYFSKYKAPAYTPAIQQFHLQPTDDQVDIGGYPIINVYANLHLKRTRIFAMMYHVNQGMGSANSFLVPHYPINPRLFKIGISWNFYD